MPKTVFALQSSERTGAGSTATEFLLRQFDSIQAAKVLSRLTRAIQKHRGATIACINGEVRFLPLAESLQQQVAKLFGLLSCLESRKQLFHSGGLSAAVGEWQAIADGWQLDTVVNNYEFHCHLIDTLGRLTRDEITQWILTSAAITSGSGLGKGTTTLLFDVPEHIELLAKLRGLATHVAFSGACDHDCHIRISFLHKKIGRESPRLYAVLGQLRGAFSSLPGIPAIRAQHLNLEYLLGMIETGILGAQQIDVDGSRIFDLATDTIDVYWTLVEQAIQEVENLLFAHYLSANDVFDDGATLRGARPDARK